jgi:hypothetical protein
MAKKNNEMTADDLMQLPDIDGLVLDVRGQQAQSSSNEPTLAEKEVAEPSESSAPTAVRRKPRVKKEPKKTAMPIEGNPL